MNSSIRIGIVGTGRAARIHAEVFKTIKSAEVCGIAGRDSLKVSSIAKKMHIPNCFESIEELILSPNIDAVVLALPPFQQPDLAIKAFKHGKHVLCEKPLAVNLRDAKKVFVAWKSSKRIGMVNFCYRLIPQFARFKQQLAEGLCGHINYLQAEWVLSTRLNKNLTFHWKGEKNMGGGVLQNFGVHLLDYLCYDKRLVKVIGAKQDTYIKTRLDNKGSKCKVTGDEMTTVFLDVDGTSVLIHLSLISNPAIGFCLLARGSTGTLELRNSKIESPAGPFSIWFHREGKKVKCLSKGETDAGNSLFSLFYRTGKQFIDAIGHDDLKNEPNIKDGVNACRILGKIQKIADLNPQM